LKWKAKYLSCAAAIRYSSHDTIYDPTFNHADGYQLTSEVCMPAVMVLLIIRNFLFVRAVGVHSRIKIGPFKASYIGYRKSKVSHLSAY